MTGIAESPALLMIAGLLLVGGSLVVLAWGRKLPRQGDWLIGFGLLGLFVASGAAWTLFSERSFAPELWLRGWILPKGEPGAITIGVLRDTLGVSVATLAGLVAVSVLFGTGKAARATRVERFYASMGLACGGVALAWFALTPWMSLIGTSFVLLGGFFALGSLTDQSAQAALATRYGWERSWGLILALFGLCVLAGSRAPLTFSQVESAGASDWAGLFLLFCGAFAQLQPFPLLGGVMTDSQAYGPARIVVSQVFPAWAAFAVLMRLEPRFREIGLFPDLGWIGLASAVLASVAGLFAGRWRMGTGAWLSAGFSLSVAILAFIGPGPAACLWIGVGLSACALAGFGEALEESDASAENSSGSQITLWAKIGCVLAAAAGTGWFGFVISGGVVRAFSIAWAQPALAAGIGVVFFLFAALGWKIAWQAMAASSPSGSSKTSTSAGWNVVLLPYLPVLFALGMNWTGTVSGGAIPGDLDRLFGSLFALFFGSSGEAWGPEDLIAPAIGVYWSLLVLATGTAYWTEGRSVAFWQRAGESMPRFSAFVLSGYGVDALVAHLRSGLAWVGRLSVRVLDRSAWDTVLPGIVSEGVRRVASAIAVGDLKLSRGISGILRSWVDTPSRVFQVIQNGDVQWYVFFAVSSGIAILAHFMMKT